MTVTTELLRNIFHQCICLARRHQISDDEFAIVLAEAFDEDFIVALRPDGPTAQAMAMVRGADA